MLLITTATTRDKGYTYYRTVPLATAAIFCCYLHTHTHEVPSLPQSCTEHPLKRCNKNVADCPDSCGKICVREPAPAAATIICDKGILPTDLPRIKGGASAVSVSNSHPRTLTATMVPITSGPSPTSMTSSGSLSPPCPSLSFTELRVHSSQFTVES